MGLAFFSAFKTERDPFESFDYGQIPQMELRLPPDVENEYPIYNYDISKRCLSASCRLTTDRSIGSGTVFNIDDEYVWILSAGHVVEGSTVVLAEFWRSGSPSFFMNAEVVWYMLHPSPCEDLSILRVLKSKFSELGQPLPYVMPLASPKFKIRVDTRVMSMGCEQGYSPTMIIGFVKRVDENIFYMVPDTMYGRSGSAVLDETGTRIIGVVVRRDGICVNLNCIYRLTGWNKSYSDKEKEGVPNG